MNGEVILDTDHLSWLDHFPCEPVHTLLPGAPTTVERKKDVQSVTVRGLRDWNRPRWSSQSAWNLRNQETEGERYGEFAKMGKELWAWDINRASPTSQRLKFHLINGR